MTIGMTPVDTPVGAPVRLYSQKVGFCEWRLDGGRVVKELPDGSIMVRWSLPGLKHIVLIRTSPHNGQQRYDARTIMVL